MVVLHRLILVKTFVKNSSTATVEILYQTHKKRPPSTDVILEYSPHNWEMVLEPCTSWYYNWHLWQLAGRSCLTAFVEVHADSPITVWIYRIIRKRQGTRSSLFEFVSTGTLQQQGKTVAPFMINRSIVKSLLVPEFHRNGLTQFSLKPPSEILTYL